MGHSICGLSLPPSNQVLDALNESVSQDPPNHLESFKTLTHLEGVLDEIMYRAFTTTLKGLARVWFNKLAPNTVSTFKELSGHFVTHFIGG